MPLIIQMNVHITGMTSAMPAKGQVRRQMEPVLDGMQTNKDKMETCLGLLLELASEMAGPGQNCCHKLQCLQSHVVHCFGLIM